MTGDASRSVAALGLGNPMRTDDGAGIYAIRKLSDADNLPIGVQVIEGGTLGLELLHHLRGVTHLLVLDVVDTGSAPGTLSRFVDEELAAVPTARSVHLLGLADLLGSMKLLGEAPEEVVLLGIQPESTNWGVTLSPCVDAALSQLLEAAVTQLLNWTAATEEPAPVMASRGLA
jgi:hydrogenase maturation protease